VNTEQFLDKLKSEAEMKFSDFINLIEKEYIFTNVAFTNNGLYNSIDENQGSAKVFCFGIMHSLSEIDTLRCFGEHYRFVVQFPYTEI